MTVHQLSVFLENKSGTLVKVFKLLKAEGIQLIASTIADTAEYGICRIICSEPDKAYEVLRSAGVAVSLCEVFAIELDDEVGELAKTLEIFNQESISITYLYSFLLNGKGIMIFRTMDGEKTTQVIQQNGMKYITEKNLYKLV